MIKTCCLRCFCGCGCCKHSSTNEVSNINDAFTIESTEEFTAVRELWPSRESIFSAPTKPNNKLHIYNTIDDLTPFSLLQPRIRPMQMNDETDYTVQGLPTVVRKDLHYSSIMTTGSFGKYYIAHYGNDSSQTYLVKTLEEDRADPLTQALFYADTMSHRSELSSAMQLLGVSNNQFPILSVFRYTSPIHQLQAESFDLKSYLLSADPAPTFQTVLEFCFNICEGLEDLHQRGLVHQDLGCRSCLLKGSGVCLGEIQAPELLHLNDYCNLENGSLVALRWMDPHTFFLPSNSNCKLSKSNFIPQGNVWSFGVIIMEIMLLCSQQPFARLHETALMHTIFITKEHLLQQPDNENLEDDVFIPDSDTSIPIPFDWPSEVTWPLRRSTALFQIAQQCWTVVSKRPPLQLIRQMLMECREKVEAEQQSGNENEESMASL